MVSVYKYIIYAQILYIGDFLVFELFAWTYKYANKINFEFHVDECVRIKNNIDLKCFIFSFIIIDSTSDVNWGIILYFCQQT